MKHYLVRVPVIEEAIACFESEGFRLHSIFPAEHPNSALLGNGIETIRIKRDASSVLSQALRKTSWESLECDEDSHVLSLPKITLENRYYSKTCQKVTDGRAGMQYRDLIPDKLDGFLIGSRISIPGSGPVRDYVHYHKLYFQLLYCLKGSATLAYEGQGEPFRFAEGDLILQPPLLRHRVLESYDDLEVLEFSCPAEHETLRDYSTVLPSQSEKLTEAGKQSFLHEHLNGRSQSIKLASSGILDVRLIDLSHSEFFERPENGICVGYQISGKSEILSDAHYVSTEGESFYLASTFRITSVTDSKILMVSIDPERLQEFASLYD